MLTAYLPRVLMPTFRLSSCCGQEYIHLERQIIYS